MTGLTKERETTAEPVISLTPTAVAQAKRRRAKQGDESLCLRIGVKGGGCSGLSYVMDLEPAPADGDLVYDFDGLTVLVDPKSARFITGTTIDYDFRNLLEGGWKFENPRAAQSCGCGTSFTPK